MDRDYPGDWNSRRKRVYKRDNYACQNCGAKGGHKGDAEIHAHHVVPKSKGGSHRESNLITVCKECHYAIHGNRVAPPAQKEGSIADLVEGPVADIIQIFKSFNFAGAMNMSAQYSYTLSDILRQDHSQREQYEAYKQNLLYECYKSNRHIEALKEVSTRAMPQEMAESYPVFIDAWEQWAIIQPRVIQDADEVVQLLRDRYCGNVCPVCGSVGAISNNCCGECGAMLEAIQLEANGKEMYIRRGFSDRLSELKQSIRDIGHTSKIMRKIADRCAEEIDVNQSNWEHCPNCGVKHSPQMQNERIAICGLCKSKWKRARESGTNWKMIEGEQSGKKLSEQEWAEKGQQRYEQDRYLDYS